MIWQHKHETKKQNFIQTLFTGWICSSEQTQELSYCTLHRVWSQCWGDRLVQDVAQHKYKPVCVVGCCDSHSLKTREWKGEESEVTSKVTAEISLVSWSRCWIQVEDKQLHRHLLSVSSALKSQSTQNNLSKSDSCHSWTFSQSCCSCGLMEKLVYLFLHNLPTISLVGRRQTVLHTSLLILCVRQCLVHAAELQTFLSSVRNTSLWSLRPHEWARLWDTEATDESEGTSIRPLVLVKVSSPPSWSHSLLLLSIVTSRTLTTLHTLTSTIYHNTRWAHWPAL